MIEGMRKAPMRRFLWLAISAFLATAALAQSTQHNESDLVFVNRLSSKAGRLATRVDNLFTVTGYQRSGRSASNNGGTGFGIGVPNDTHGSPRTSSRTGSLVTEDDLNRVNRKLVSIIGKLDKQRESLESREELSEKQLAKRDKTLQQIDRDLERLERDIDTMERQLR